MDLLSNELLTHICMFLYTPKYLILFGRCNWHLHTLTNDTHIWKYVFKFTYPHIYTKYTSTSISIHWKLLFNQLVTPYTISIITPSNRYNISVSKLLSYSDYYNIVFSHIHLHTCTLIILTDKTNRVISISYTSHHSTN